MYACISVLTKLMYFQQIIYLLGVNQYYGDGYVRIGEIFYNIFHGTFTRNVYSKNEQGRRAGLPPTC